MHLGSHAAVWNKPAHEEDQTREESASSFPSVAPTGVTPLFSLGQNATTGWNQKQKQQNLHQQQHQQQKSPQQQTHFAPPDGHWGKGVDYPSMKDNFQQGNNNHKPISIDTTASGLSDQHGVSQHTSRAGSWADIASGRSNQHDVYQHSRDGTWTDDHSRRSSHTSTSSGTTSCTGTIPSNGTHPFASAANPTATFYTMGTSSSHVTHPYAAAAAAAIPTSPTNISRTSHHYDDSLFGNLGKLSLGGHEWSQHPYYNAMSMAYPPRTQQHAPTPHHPYCTSAVGEATTQQMRAGSEFTGGGANTKYGWSPQQQHSSLKPNTLERDGSSLHSASTATTRTADYSHPILPQALQLNNDLFDHMMLSADEDDGNDESEADEDDTHSSSEYEYHSHKEKKWLLRMNCRLAEIPVGELDPARIPLKRVMNTWAEIKTSLGATMFEMWLKRVEQEYDADNDRTVPTAEMYAMAVDVWAGSGEGSVAAQRAESLLIHMNKRYTAGGHDALRPTTGIFSAVVTAWARSKEKVAPRRAEQILNRMQKLGDVKVKPDKYICDTIIHAWAGIGGVDAAINTQKFLTRMHEMYEKGNLLAKPDTISYNVVVNAWAKSGAKEAASEAQSLLRAMHHLHELGDADVKPNVVTYGAVIDSLAKSGDGGYAAARAGILLAIMIQLHQFDPVVHADLLPNTHVFNTVINCWAKSKARDAASKADEVLVAMNRLHASGMPSLKPDAFTYTAVIDAWTKSGFRDAAARADQLLDEMEAKYLAGDMDLKPNTFTYTAVLSALAKSGEAGAAARAERVLQNMVNHHRNGGDDDVPTNVKIHNGGPNHFSYT